MWKGNGTCWEQATRLMGPNPDVGTGDGAHFPGMCDCFKRYLAEGGDASDPPNGRQFLQSALRERRRTA